MMRMTKQADYAIVLMTYFARAEPDLVLSARDLANTAHLPIPTVTKLLKIMARDGLLVSQRGLKGGYSLAREPQDISVAQVITAIEGPIAITQCSGNASGCAKSARCPTQENWSMIDKAVREALNGISIDEMSRPLSHVPPVELVATHG